MTSILKNDQQKSKKRIVDHGEVFTSTREVNAMLDLVKDQTEIIDSKFLEPACGTGNFLVEVLKRKLQIVENKYKRSQLEFERNAVLAISSIYGVDILSDNVNDCIERLFTIVDSKYTKLYKKLCKVECREAFKFILKRNILLGNALDFTNPETEEPVVFSEWKFISGSLIKRRDFRYKYLVDKTNATKHLSDLGNSSFIDEPVKDFPVIHFLKIPENA